MTAITDRETRGLVFNIQKYSIHDGPGIRTIIFLKGCPLACRWCSNPESQSFAVELAFNAGRCLGLDHCDLVGCARQGVATGTRHELCRTLHAEQNAIIQAALHCVNAGLKVLNASGIIVLSPINIYAHP